MSRSAQAYAARREAMKMGIQTMNYASATLRGRNVDYTGRNPNTFSKSQAPKGYVGGAGRGAIGFTTRSDVGPALAAAPGGVAELAEGGRGVGGLSAGATGRTDFGQAPAGYRVRGAETQGKFGKDKGDGREQDYSEANYDKETGFGHSLFSDSLYELEDREADR